MMPYRAPSVASTPLEVDIGAFRRWVRCGTVADRNAKHTTAELLDAYHRWLAEHAPRAVPLQVRKFRQQLQRVCKGRGSTTGRRWVGLRPADVPGTSPPVQAAALGLALRALRVNAGLTQDDMAEKLGICRSTVQRAESSTLVATDLVQSWQRICGGTIIFTVYFGEERP